MGMDEEVLCIKRWAFDRNVDHFFGGAEFLPEDLATLLTWHIGSHVGPAEISFVPRSECEKDPRWLQIVPYTVVARPDHSGDGILKWQILDYHRPNSGGESRLYGKASIGFGGHINPIDSGEWYLSSSPSVMTYVINCASRELEEELGVDECSVQGLGWLMDPTTDVGLVHVGAVVLVVLPKDANIIPSKEVLDPGWVSLDSLKSGLPDEVASYENWSQVLIKSSLFDSKLLSEARMLGGVPNYSSE